jgi:23S rRNA (adenine1618-N6)-methyltransferase
MEKKKEHPKEKILLHPRNKHRQRYDFNKLIQTFPELGPYVQVNAYQEESIDFFDPQAVKMLNTALLKLHYSIDYWDIPAGYLCPPIPGRADYVHYLADLLAGKNNGVVPIGPGLKCLDIGVGANCVYPIIGHQEYGWSFTGTDIDPVALESASRIVHLNSPLRNMVELRVQNNSRHIYEGIINEGDLFDLTLCNPPFFASKEESQSASLRKLSHLKRKKITQPSLNFGGQNSELWCDGGEGKFVTEMIRQSKVFSSSCFWFSTLISQKAHLQSAYRVLQKVKALESKTISMAQGNKVSRMLAWTFLNVEQQNMWIHTRWDKKNLNS